MLRKFILWMVIGAVDIYQRLSSGIAGKRKEGYGRDGG